MLLQTHLAIQVMSTRTPTLRLIPVQASQAAAASGTQAFTLRLQQAKASLAQLDAELHSNQHLLQRHLRECEGWASRHQHTVQALRDQLPQELMLPDSHWMFAQAPLLLGGLHVLSATRFPSVTRNFGYIFKLLYIHVRSSISE